MAARRLVVVMLVLLAVSTLVTALLPRPQDDDPAPVETAPSRKDRSEAPPKPPRTGLDLVAQMRAGSPQPKSVRIERGDELLLDVIAGYGADVEILGLGEVLPVTPFAAAQFGLFATDTGTFPVRVVDPMKLVGRLLVGKPGSGRCGVRSAATPGAPAEPESARSCRRLERP